MFLEIIGIILGVLFIVIFDIEEVRKDKLQKEYDNIDWNEYYANI